MTWKSFINITLCLLMSIIMLLTFSSCKNKEYSIREITGIKDEYPISIQATFNDEYVGTCEINDPELIKQIVDILHARVYNYTNKSPYPGSNRSLTLIYESGETVHFSTRSISNGKRGYYSPIERDELDSIIGKYGIDTGDVVPR